MAEPCARRNPLARSGLTQDGRRRAELETDHFLPDERDIADLVLFGQRFAKHVRYYDSENKAAGDWSAFFEADPTASLAALAKLPVEAFRAFQLDLERWLKADPGRDPDQLSAHAKLFLHLPLALFEMAGAHHARLPGDHPFTAALAALAGRDLKEPLTGLIGWYKGAVAVPGPDNSIFADSALAKEDYNVTGQPGDARVRLSSTVATAVLGRPAFSAAPVPETILAMVPPGTWTGLYAATDPDASPYVDASSALTNKRYEQIYDALSYNLLTTAIEHIYHGVDRIRRDATTHLTASLETFAGHAPHYGLWLAFLQLFEHAKGELNAFTARHLDFYFREVLRLSARPPVPDKVHLLFELAKGHAAHLLTAGTLFRAGKDALGRPVSYALENDIVINRASIAELRALRVETGGATAVPAQTPRAALVVPSRDGLGEVDLPKDSPSWPPFGPAASPAARVGFAIADRKLFLREGTRIIRIRADLKAPTATTDIAPRWTVRLTGDEGWFEVTGAAQVKTVLDNSFSEPIVTPGWKEDRHRSRHDGGLRSFIRSDVKGSSKPPASKYRRILDITVTLSPDDPPVVPFDAKIHGDDHALGVPVIEIAFDFAAETAARAFAVLRDIKAEQVTLRIEASGLKNLMVVAGGAVADISKPFAPFGAQPRKGASWIIGSSEIFSKHIEAWHLELEWETPCSEGGFFWKRKAATYNPEGAILSGGRWASFGAVDIQLGSSAEVEAKLSGAPPVQSLVDQTLENPSFGAGSVSGFLRLQLMRDFGHAAFVRENTRALIALAVGTAYSASKRVNTCEASKNESNSNSNRLPCEPYDAVVTRLEAAYKTRREAVAAFSLLQPFGVSAGAADGRLFPEFPFEGALLVGVADFAAPARLTLLIQVADGSGDPLKKAPELDFAFLAGDEWVGFASHDVDDKTRNLTGSGVLGLNLPEAADTAHSVMPAGLHWIRITAPRDAVTLNRLLSIDAQAARATFADAGNDPAFLETPLPAGAISKLATPDLAIKKVVQPYSSFDGRSVEDPDAFATRVSERLRHKDRAVTMFDYEALVLEAFPRLYRVKCLNTTELKRASDNVIIADNELMPGAVTVVAVPWTHGQNARDPLRPYTDQATLAAVAAFLRKRVPPFVRLEVRNPKFEEVHVDFRVRFMPGTGDVAFYIDELNKAVVGFLTPWARPGGGEIIFGGKLWKSSIIDFVEEQPQVDFLTDFRLYHKVDINTPPGGWSPVDVEVIEATTARSILVSATRHTITEAPRNA